MRNEVACDLRSIGLPFCAWRKRDTVLSRPQIEALAAQVVQAAGLRGYHFARRFTWHYRHHAPEAWQRRFRMAAEGYAWPRRGDALDLSSAQDVLMAQLRQAADREPAVFGPLLELQHGGVYHAIDRFGNLLLV